MSARARATALALVNWKGVFYERYLLDPHVTALEGANGAGKTTVMIAAYVALLPDMSRLRFTNLGESGATGGDKGIWGRLGEPGRPSYCVLEIELPQGTRLLAGVHLERKAEPSVALTPFIVKGLKLDGRLREALLLSEGEHDQVPELGELRDTLRRLGASLEVFPTAKEYFAALFELGVTPLRLASDAERNKLNEMLRTSMTGGISRVLTSELCSFLLKEETGLSDILTRMRANLNACQRTRQEVSEAQQLEHEISGVFEAGQAMFAAALFAAQKTSSEHAARLETARTKHREPESARQALAASAEEVRARQATVHQRVEAARSAYERAVLVRETIVRARALSARLEQLQSELDHARESFAAARTAHDFSGKSRAAERAARDRAREAYDRATHGLAHLQSGLEELHRNAHAHRHVLSRLEAARMALDRPELGAEDADAALAALTPLLGGLDRERAQVDRDLQLSGSRADEWQRAYAALVELDREALPEGAHETARRALGRLARLDDLVLRIPELAAELERCQQGARAQASVEKTAREHGLSWVAGSAMRAVERQLMELDEQLRACELTAQSEEAHAGSQQLAGEEARKQSALHSSRSARWDELAALRQKLVAQTEATLDSRRSVHEARARWAETREQLRQRVLGVAEARSALLAEASALEAHGGSFPLDLLRIRDELGAELVIDRFEELELGEAARLQARLGPLAHALIVERPAEAARSLLGRPRELESLWLVDPDATLSLNDAIKVSEGDLLIEESSGVRLTRMPVHPTLGRAARERRAAELREQAEERVLELESSTAELRTLDQRLRDGDALLEAVDLLEAPDPRSDAEAARLELERARSAEKRAATAALFAQRRASELRPRVEALRSLLGEAHWLDAPNQADRQGELARHLEQAVAARHELSCRAEPRRVLSELQDALRSGVPKPEQHALSLARRQQLEVERDRLFFACGALAEVVQHRQALAFSDAERQVSERTAGVPALEAQHQAAKAAVEGQERQLTEAEAAWETSTATRLKAEAEYQAILAHTERVKQEFEAEGVADASEAACRAAHEELLRLASSRSAVEVEERALATDLALREERRAHAELLVESSRVELAAAELAAAPAEQRWRELQAAAERAGVLRSASTQRFHARLESQSSLSLFSEARGKGSLLVDRLLAARGGAECAEALRGLIALGPQPEAEGYLTAWQLTRDWLKRRLPAPIADVDEPLEALDRLRNDLALLELRLGRQENDLKGASEDVARGIEVQLRRAGAQVRRLNQNLEGVRFGSISAIRVQMRRVERMEQVLRALREGAAQELLFSSKLPIEEALDEIFRRYGGGRSGGQKILDYREYLELGVEIQRQTSSDWEGASPTKLSTGEAIGVGAALMMVVLTEWERDANLLRGKRLGGSLRFLFLDEANRLSQENLGVLFDLCANLDLQLMIAAPEVARAHGNTTYRLVRRLSDDGREEVLVSGRRTLVDGSGEAGTSADLAPLVSLAGPREQAQLSLLGESGLAETSDAS